MRRMRRFYIYWYHNPDSNQPILVPTGTAVKFEEKNGAPVTTHKRLLTEPVQAAQAPASKSSGGGGFFSGGFGGGGGGAAVNPGGPHPQHSSNIYKMGLLGVHRRVVGKAGKEVRIVDRDERGAVRTRRMGRSTGRDEERREALEEEWQEEGRQKMRSVTFCDGVGIFLLCILIPIPCWLELTSLEIYGISLVRRASIKAIVDCISSVRGISMVHYAALIGQRHCWTLIGHC